MSKEWMIVQYIEKNMWILQQQQQQEEQEQEQEQEQVNIYWI